MTYQTKAEVEKILETLVEGDEVRVLYAFPIPRGARVSIETGYFRPYQDGNSSFYVHPVPDIEGSNYTQFLTEWVLNLTKVRGKEDIERELADACEEGSKRYLRRGE